MRFVRIAVAIALNFSPLVSATAFMITFGEYVRHDPDKKKPVRLAVEAALVTLVFFIVLSFIIGFLLDNIVGSQSL